MTAIGMKSRGVMAKVPFGWRSSRRNAARSSESGWVLSPRERSQLAASLVLERFEDVEPRSTACRQNRSEDPGDHGDRGEDHELRQRDMERHALARERPREEGGEKHTERQPEGGTDQGGDDALVADHPPQLAAADTDPPQHPDLACSLEHGEDEGVDHPEQAHDH